MVRGDHAPYVQTMNEGSPLTQAVLPPDFADWFARQGWTPHPHQLALLEAQGDSLLIAPTGGGKTLAGFLPSLVELAEGWKGLHTLYV